MKKQIKIEKPKLVKQEIKQQVNYPKIIKEDYQLIYKNLGL